MFTTHMASIGYSSYFTKIEQFKEGGGDNLDIPETSTDHSLNDMKELISTNEGYRQHGRKVAGINLNLPTVSQKSTLVRTNIRSSGMEMRKTLIESSDDGSDNDPPMKNLKKSHIVYTSSKRKTDT